jgi:AcrR family transcriptional regulator
MTAMATGKRKSERTRAAILAAARDLFAEHGYDRTTVRDVAARAATDPSLVIRYFGSKEQLFAKAAVFDLRLPDLGAVDRREVGQVLVRHFLDTWEGVNGNSGLPVLLRSAASNEFAAEMVLEIFASQVMPALARIAPADVRERAGLIATQILGLALCRYILKLQPVAEMGRDDVIRWVGAVVQHYACGDREGPSAHSLPP